MNILVTGGAGFIGSHICRELLAAGYRVVALDDLSGGFEENIPPGVTFIKGSILDRDLLEKLFLEHHFDIVYHLAAYAAEGLSPFIRHFNYQNNLIGSVNLINLSVKFPIKRFIFTSSIAVYGSDQVPMLESMTPQPEDPYGISKYAVELDLKAAHALFGLPYTIFRPHNVYGEFQNLGDRYRNVLGIFMNQIMNSEPLTFFGDGTQTRAFSYISDVTRPMILCLKTPETIGEVFNVGADQPYSVLELAKTIMTCMQKEVPIQRLPARHEVMHAYASHEKIRRFFTTLPEPTPLQVGVKRMATWAMSSGPRKSKRFKNIEILKNMPPSWMNDIETPLSL